MENEKHQTGKKHLQKYRKHLKKKITFGITITILLIISFTISVAYGSVNIPIIDTIYTLLGYPVNEMFHNIIWNIRLPQAITAFIAGAGLGIAGTVMQNVLRNPLGAPYTLGISHAAAFGAATAIMIFGVGQVELPISGRYAQALSAFIMSLLTAAIIVAIAKYKNATPATMVLTGIALGSLFSAGLSVFQYIADDEELASIVYWTFGDVGRTSWNEVTIIAIGTAIPALYFITKAYDYNILNAGDETAKSLGVNAERLRMEGMFFASLVTAVAVAFVGIIGFVGLVVPHIVRRVIGTDERFLIPYSMIGGGLLVLISDIVARNMIEMVTLPVGILTAFIGAPLFIYLVLVGRENW
ncbi:ABC-type Fe(3+)-siderophore transport system permease component [Methanonatronarchaeum thermophilum]|uniref:ABC-type Fe(3+)-siderophore transport system permease component n=1 Tax=Methanonatronarchaeum thermophilum TaxID=1927129 RepID=A0A1Y3GC87_9EURY|nr:iron ABC transporter permease [Methanonatronarchaeum thermophilum]OUJ19048.1 ABC-type Fe(3+)-siderophore transport system permease component [Methanonatronarchaeum thermophilum]